MKKGRPKKKPPRFSTRILLAALAAALAINGYFAWQILGKSLQTEQTQTAAGTVPAEVQERLDAQEERENEIAESGSVSYSPSGDRLNDREAGAVYDESSAMDALEALQYDMNIGNVREEYQCVDRQTVGIRDYYTMQTLIPLLSSFCTVSSSIIESVTTVFTFSKGKARQKPLLLNFV